VNSLEDLQEIACKEEKDGKINIVVSRIKPPNDRRCLLYSNFRRFWAHNHRHVQKSEYKTAVAAVISAWANEKRIPPSNALRFFMRLNLDRKGSDISEWAMCDWTSAHSIMNMGRGDEVEFCTMLSHALRMDKLPAVAHAVTCLLALRDKVVRLEGDRTQGLVAPPSIPWPSTKKTFRGTAMPEEAREFFIEGRKYRVPWALATSSSEAVADGFVMRSQVLDRKPVIFEVDVSSEPYHVNYVESAVAGEFEFLFIPYSCFKVTQVVKGRIWRIRIKAFEDNKPKPGETTDSMEWELSPWH